ncbi:hypothetical protein F0562_011705 [Nyssa sinensis]|uniref:Phorbol-ester/DAG-type domain-containing protein n=1 Tax=Nyssa sinensis TaxID=561372 RepID=A0A5J4ZV58_9ASTE|nr:hypothetical protein F0562_011705 [Nyssa sinensis]
MEAIKHFSHGHPLLPCDCEEGRGKCFLCDQLIRGSAYGCEPCFFSIHTACAELHLKIVHPFHPQHALTLTKLEEFECSVCGRTPSPRGFAYHCSDCQFDLDVACATLKQVNQLPPSLINGHPHPLILCNNLNDKYMYLPILCSVCDQSIKDSIYVCLQCKLLLHESCINLPQEIKHPFHPDHSLLLRTHPSKLLARCSACSACSLLFTYNCSECEFDLDVHCAALMPITEDQDHHQTQHLRCFHYHPLIRCNNKPNFPFTCKACDLPFENYSLYVCLQCRILIHESCVELPKEIKHPFHQQHESLLTLMTSYSEVNHCRACGKFAEGFGYRCFQCRFKLHTRCAWPIPPFVKSEHHEHPLAFFNAQIENSFCNSCHKLCNRPPFFRCAQCDLSLHLHCYPNLPPTIKHICHLHPLTFTNSPIKDYSDEEEDDDDLVFYCDACEENRNLFEPTYYCAECHYVSHVGCVISEVSWFLEEWTLASKLGDTELDTPIDVVKEKIDEAVGDISGPFSIDEVDKEVEELDTKLEAGKENLEIQKRILQVLRAELVAEQRRAEEQELLVEALKKKKKALIFCGWLRAFAI